VSKGQLMIASHYVTRIVAALAGIFGTIILIGLTRPGVAQEKASQNSERIGVYDSRAVAVAYAGSAFLENKMKDLKGQLKKARGAGDTKEVTRLEAEGQAWQTALHKQGFGTAPVDDLLAHIAAELPKIQADAGVTKFVSKWDKTELGKHPKAGHVDVTMRLVDAFHPNERQRKHAIEIQNKSPEKVKD
jgi:hypothetical protein